MGGCATQKLWEEGTLANYHEPATPSNLGLYQATNRTDFLVLYDESSERSDSIQRRAYWLGANSDRIKARRKPHFVAVKTGEGLLPIPIGSDGQTLASPASGCPYALSSTNGDSFTLHWPGSHAGPYELPVYPDASGRTKQVLLTPLTVAADITIVGGFLFVMFYPASAEAVSCAVNH
ncbi:MAG: hypothetical protein C5B50_01520 [Verrucomicrobia bacterium]|nr:MAG: hypothetical protein C5B50_01520 [Verrucomicrobiota bacterium]